MCHCCVLCCVRFFRSFLFYRQTLADIKPGKDMYFLIFFVELIAAFYILFGKRHNTLHIAHIHIHILCVCVLLENGFFLPIIFFWPFYSVKKKGSLFENNIIESKRTDFFFILIVLSEKGLSSSIQIFSGSWLHVWPCTTLLKKFRSHNETLSFFGVGCWQTPGDFFFPFWSYR